MKDVFESFIAIRNIDFHEWLDKDKSVSIHHQNIQKLGIEMFKVLNGENPQIVNAVFRIRDQFVPFQRYIKYTISLSENLGTYIKCC